MTFPSYFGIILIKVRINSAEQKWIFKLKYLTVDSVIYQNGKQEILILKFISELKIALKVLDTGTKRKIAYLCKCQMY